MTIRSFATSASVITVCLIGAAQPGVSGEITRDQTVPFMIAAAQNAAPDFTGISNWFNSAPLNMAKLRGKVVLVDFWTYGCVNCVNTLPTSPSSMPSTRTAASLSSASTRPNFRSRNPHRMSRPR